MIPSITNNIHFLNPWYLSIGALLYGALFLLTLVPAIRRMLGITVSRLLIKIACVGLLTAIMANPVYRTVRTVDTFLALVDMSTSMDASKRETLIKELESYAPTGTTIQMIPFAGKVGTKIPLSARASLDSRPLIPKDSDLEEALRALNSQEGSAAFLISDGYSTHGSQNGLVSAAQTAPMPMFVLTEKSSVRPNAGKIEISQLTVPLIGAPGESVPIRVSLQNTHESTVNGNLTITQDKKEIFNRNVAVKNGEEPVIVQRSDAGTEGMQEIVATFRSNTGKETSTRTAYLSTQKRARLLLLSGDAQDEKLVKEVLTELGFPLTTELAKQTSSGSDALTPESYPAVILNNIGYSSLPISLTKSLKSYVHSGGGLLVLGGNKSFGLGGYTDTEIGRLFPVESTPPKAEQKRVNVAVTLVLDKSRSMASEDRLLYAKEAAKEVIKNLKDEDYVGVIGFDSTPFIVVRLAQLATTRDTALSRVDRLFPAGRTNLLPALDEARRNLAAAQAGRKHIIVLTDGRLPDGGPYYVDLVREMKIQGITVSTVLLSGDMGDGTLEGMAQAGGGNFYQTENARSLPRIFLQDVMVAGADRTMEEKPELFVARGPGTLTSTSITSFPPLRGFVRTIPKPTANRELDIKTSDGDAPLLASWQLEKGKVVAFTSDANGRWSSFWAKWPKFNAFWGEVINSLQAKDQKKNSSISFGVRHFTEYGTLVIEPTIYTAGVYDLQGSITFPDGKEHTLAFQTAAAGRFQTTLPNPASGVYKLKLRTNINSSPTALPEVALVVEPNQVGEQPWQGFNYPLLEELAIAGRGKINPSKEDIPKRGQEIKNDVSLAAPLFLGVLLLLLGDAVVRVRRW